MNNGIFRNNNVIFVNNNDKVIIFKVNIEGDINWMGVSKKDGYIYFPQFSSPSISGSQIPNIKRRNCLSGRISYAFPLTPNK